MLKDVEHSRVVFGQGAEPYGEQLVLFAVVCPHELRACDIVAHLDQPSAGLLYISYTRHGEPVHSVVYIQHIYSLSVQLISFRFAINTTT